MSNHKRSNLEITADEFDCFLLTSAGKEYRDATLRQLYSAGLSSQDAEKVFREYMKLQLQNDKNKESED